MIPSCAPRFSTLVGFAEGSANQELKPFRKSKLESLDRGSAAEVGPAIQSVRTVQLARVTVGTVLKYQHRDLFQNSHSHATRRRSSFVSRSRGRLWFKHYWLRIFVPCEGGPLCAVRSELKLSLIHISEPTRLLSISYAV